MSASTAASPEDRGTAPPPGTDCQAQRTVASETKARDLNRELLRQNEGAAIYAAYMDRLTGPYGSQLRDQFEAEVALGRRRILCLEAEIARLKDTPTRRAGRVRYGTRRGRCWRVPDSAVSADAPSGTDDESPDEGMP
jgi:hypothetical protein